MKRRWVGAALVLALAACQPGQVVEVTVLPNGHVKVALPDDLPGCIETLSFGRYDGENFVATVWDIEGYQAPSCPKELEYPSAPKGFKTNIQTRPLAPGRYSVIGYGNGVHLSGEFTIPAR